MSKARKIYSEKLIIERNTVIDILNEFDEKLRMNEGRY